MKNLKVLGLAAPISAALMAFATSASADYVTTTTGGSPATPPIHTANESGHLDLQTGSVVISCASTGEGTVENHGTGVPASGKLSHFTVTGCTNFWHVTTETPGSISLTHTSGHNGALDSDGIKVRATRLGVGCVYETNNTPIATMTGGNPATLHVEASIPIVRSESSELCGTTTSWKGSYVFATALYVVNS